MQNKRIDGRSVYVLAVNLFILSIYFAHASGVKDKILVFRDIL